MEFDVIVATHNENKMMELRHFFKDYTIKLSSLRDIQLSISIDESGQSFLDNALMKARVVAKYVNKPVLSDDSGLMIESLGGFPGLKSKRFMTGSSYVDKNLAIIKMMQNHQNRKATFNCTMVLMYPNGDYRIFIGTCLGQVTYELRGDNGFGYDPIFICDELDKTFAEATIDEKQTYSHRGKAVSKAITCLCRNGLMKAK